MQVFKSNRVETLVAALGEVLRRPLTGPFEPEICLVHSSGMKMWLVQKLAERLAVCANVEFPFPRNYIPKLFKIVLGDEELDTGAWHSDRLVWHVLALLPELLPTPELAELNRYLVGDDSGLKRIQLAERIAHVYDDYLAYRPEMILEWDEGGGEGWQPLLWRGLRQRITAPHLPQLAAGFLARLKRGADGISDLPKRICLFGISTLPPFHLELLEALSRHVEVILFLLCPSQQYWADIRSKREMARIARLTGAEHSEDIYLTEGNPLLASLGRLGREFQEMLEDRTDYSELYPDLFGEPGCDTLLHSLQTDILNLHDRKSVQGITEAMVEQGDRSLVIHSCHGQMRQVEVLHDQLLALFDELPDLETRDVVVMVPDLEEFAPLIEAVFSREPTDQCRIPYRIADRTSRQDNPVADAFLNVLELVDSRAEAPEIMDLLTHEPIYTRFGLSTDDLDRVNRWIGESGIRWGMDGSHREEVGQPKYAENTWRFGLDRLLLGFAMPGGDEHLFGETLPYDEIEGSEALVLGNLAAFCDVLFQQFRLLRRPRPVAQWHEVLNTAIDELLMATESNVWQHQQVRETLDELAEQARTADLEEPLSLDAIRHLLSVRLTRERTNYGFLSGGLTFCAMLPMRSIPFRVVCLLGMDERAFPRNSHKLGFDLIAEKPRPGDRSPRHDDRYLFLEALLSARDRLIITYSGQSIHNHRSLPPSVVVAELIDAATDSYTFPGNPDEDREARTRAHLVVEHPLQPFSPRNFGTDSELFSYSQEYARGARALQEQALQELALQELALQEQALQKQRSRPKPFFTALLPEVEPERRAITVDDLIAFYRRPVPDFVNRRLGIRLRDHSDTLAAREPVEIDGLEKYAIGDHVLDWTTAGKDPAEAYRAIRAAGLLPLGAPGRTAFGSVVDLVQPISNRVGAFLLAEEPQPILIELTIDKTHIRGRFLGPVSGRLVRHQYAIVGAKHLLELWIQHLLLSAATKIRFSESVVVGRAGKGGTVVSCLLKRVENPITHLRRLIELYWAGQREPLMLFPDVSMEYISQLAEQPRGTPPGERVLQKTGSRWRSAAHSPVGGDGEEPHVELIFGDTEPYRPGFQLGPLPSCDGLSFDQVAKDVFGPLLSHLS